MARTADGDAARGYGADHEDDASRTRGAHGATARDGARKHASRNVGTLERVLSVAAGSALAAYGVKRRDWGGLAAGIAGGLLVERGASGHCMVYDSLGLTSADGDRMAELPHHAEGLTRQRGGSASVDAKKAQKVDQVFTIAGRTPDELYAYWRNLENLPHIFAHLEAVRELDGRRSHWTAKAPAKQTVEWDAEIVNDVPGQILAWRSLPGTHVPNAGAVRFRSAPGGRGTEVHVTLEYEPPAGKLGVLVAKLFGEEPNVQVREDLRRYKQLMETGEIAVSENPGQGARARTTFDAKVNAGRTGGDVDAAQRRAVDDAHEPVHQAVPSDDARGRNSTNVAKESR